MSDGGKGSDRRPGTGYSDGWDRVFGKRETHAYVDALKFVFTAPTFTGTLTGGVCPPGYELVKSSAIHCANDMADAAERMIVLLGNHGKFHDEIDGAIKQSEVDAIVDAALENSKSLCESIKLLHSAIHEYRKRMGK